MIDHLVQQEAVLFKLTGDRIHEFLHRLTMPAMQNHSKSNRELPGRSFVLLQFADRSIRRERGKPRAQANLRRGTSFSP
jgi:hypothetical protein